MILPQIFSKPSITCSSGTSWTWGKAFVCNNSQWISLCEHASWSLEPTETSSTCTLLWQGVPTAWRCVKNYLLLRALSLPHASWCVWPVVWRKEWGTVWSSCSSLLHTIQAPASLHPTSFQSLRLKTPNLFICSCWGSWFISLIILVICACCGGQSTVSGAFLWEGKRRGKWGRTHSGKRLVHRQSGTSSRRRQRAEQRPQQTQPSSSGMDMVEKSTSEFERKCRRLMEEN